MSMFGKKPTDALTNMPQPEPQPLPQLRPATPPKQLPVKMVEPKIVEPPKPERADPLAWFLTCNTQDILERANVEGWDYVILQRWLYFKQVQFLEVIAEKLDLLVSKE